jgi:hypothetical protein
VRRLLSGHHATDELLLVHLGKSIFAYWTDDDSESGIKEGQEAWVLGGERGITSYLRDVMGSSALARYGICIETKQDVRDRRRAHDPLDEREKDPCGYATLKAPSIDESRLMPRGRLVCFSVRTGGTMEGKKPYWDTQQFEPDESEQPVRRRKKKDEEKAAADERKTVHLSFIGTPVIGGRRIFCPAADAFEPNETYVAAVDARSGQLLWKRSLATSSPFNAQTNPWEAAYPRLMPTPSIALANGAVVALSNNGAIAALDPVDGRVLWARTYDRDEDSSGNRQPWRQNPNDVTAALSRGYNPPLPLGDMVLALPTDSKFMTLVRLTDGAQLTKPHARGKYDYVLGVAQGAIVLAGGEGVGFYGVTRDEKHKRFSIASEKVVTLGERDKLRGRGVLCKDAVYLPCTKRVLAVRLRDGKRPSAMQWREPKKEMGDLVVGGGRIFSVGARNAHTYTYKEDE